MGETSWTLRFVAENVTANSDYNDHLLAGSAHDPFHLYVYEVSWASGLRCSVKFQEDAYTGRLCGLQATLLSLCCGEEYDDFLDFTFHDDTRHLCRGCGDKIDLDASTSLALIFIAESFNEYWRAAHRETDAATQVEKWLDALGLADPLNSILDAWDLAQTLNGMAKGVLYRELAEAKPEQEYSMEDLLQAYSGHKA